LPPKRDLPWVETGPGGLFFVNAVLAAPGLMLAYAVALRALLRAFGGSGALLDPIPLVAAHAAPVVGWLAIPAALAAIWSLTVVDRGWARLLLLGFLCVHVAIVAWTLVLVAA
jgi:hypothetical protein